MHIVPDENVIIEGESLFGINWSPVKIFAKEVILSYYKEIDLTPLKLLADLEILDLSMGNKISKINLNSLSHCPNFKTLDLSENKLEELNLSPLSYCTKFENLISVHNKIRAIDLYPLSKSENLRLVNLSYNFITKIDLSPLIDNIKLSVLDLSNNPLDEIDITPLLNIKSLKSLRLSKHTKVFTTESYNSLPIGLKKYTIELKNLKK